MISRHIWAVFHKVKDDPSVKAEAKFLMLAGLGLTAAGAVILEGMLQRHRDNKAGFNLDGGPFRD
jgi:hypothetical protein